MQESSSFLNAINVAPVTEQMGEKLGLGIGGPIAGTTDTTGTAACTITPDQPLNDAGTVPLTATFAGDAFYRPSNASATLLLQFMLGKP